MDVEKLRKKITTQQNLDLQQHLDVGKLAAYAERLQKLLSEAAVVKIDAMGEHWLVLDPEEVEGALHDIPTTES